MFEKKNLYDIRDLDALIDYVKENGTFAGYKHGKKSQVTPTANPACEER